MVSYLYQIHPSFQRKELLMQKRWTLLPLALGLSLCLLTGCQQSADTDTTGNNAAISDSQLYATALGNFLQ